MSAYIDSLNAAVERERAETQKRRDEEARAAAQAAREKLVPLLTSREVRRQWACTSTDGLIL